MTRAEKIRLRGLRIQARNARIAARNAAIIAAMEAKEKDAKEASQKNLGN